MANIQKTLDSLQPYVIGIRYLEGTPLVDTVFKEGWTIPDDPKIKKVKGNDEVNYYMIFSEVEGIGLDELLAYVDRIIKVNLDREKKHELLRLKVNELKEVFKKNSLAVLTTLKFTFGEEELIPNINDFEVDEEIIPVSESNQEQTSFVEEDVEPPVVSTNESLDMTDEDREILEEEARAERNRKVTEARKEKTVTQKIAKKVELPPKTKPKLEPVMSNTGNCNCGPDEACGKCIESKDL